MGKFVISNKTGSSYHFVLKAGNGETILSSEGYGDKAGCKNGIESVRTNAPHDHRYDRLESRNNQFYFTLKAGNGQVIGTSEMYTSAANRDNGIASVKANAPGASIEDTTA